MFLMYRRELPFGIDQSTTSVQVKADDRTLWFQTKTKTSTESGLHYLADRYSVMEVGSAKSLFMIERKDGEEILATKLSAVGLETQAGEFHKRCAATEPSRSPAIGAMSPTAVTTVPVKILPVKPASSPKTSEKVKQVEPILAPETIAPGSDRFSPPFLFPSAVKLVPVKPASVPWTSEKEKETEPTTAPAGTESIKPISVKTVPMKVDVPFREAEAMPKQ